MKTGPHFPVPRRPRRGEEIAQYLQTEILPYLRRLTPQDGPGWMVSKAGVRGWAGQAAPGRRGGRITAPLLGFQLVAAARVVPLSVEAPAAFVVMPSIIDSNFHPGGADLVPELGGNSLDAWPLLTATGTRRGVYARVEITYDEQSQVQIVGDWDIQMHAAKPSETALFKDSEGIVTNGVYYRRIGTARYTTGGGLELWQDRLGPWYAEWCPTSGALLVTSPAWALSYIEAMEEEEEP